MATGETMVVITVCETCGFTPDEKMRDGETGGARLAGHVEALVAGRMDDRITHAAEGEQAARLQARRHACLMGCQDCCTIALSSPGKMTYVLGRFAAEGASAEAIVDYAALYAASDDGVVRYRDWPEGVKGHFVARVPPLNDALLAAEPVAMQGAVPVRLPAQDPLQGREPAGQPLAAPDAVVPPNLLDDV